MNKKGFSLVELMGVIVLLILIALLATSGYKMVSQRVKETSHENKVSYIETKAVEYANQTGWMQMNVDELVKEGLMSADNEEGKVIDPLDGSIMNCHLVYITEENGNFYGNYTEQEECDIRNVQTENCFIKINVYQTRDNVTIGEKVENNSWTRENVILVAEFMESSISVGEVEKIVWKSNALEEEREVQGDFTEKNRYLVTAEQIVNSIYSVEIRMEDGTIYQAEVGVRIDKQRPILYDQEIRIEKENEYTASDKEIRVSASDGSGSGIYGYSIGESPLCNEVVYEETENNLYQTRKPMGVYYICVKDKAGNVSEDVSTRKVEVKYIDSEPPKVKVKKNPLTLGTENYEFRNNLEVVWGESGEGSISCDPTASKKTGTYNVKCTIIGKNGLTEEVSFEVKHSYPAPSYKEKYQESCNPHPVKYCERVSCSCCSCGSTSGCSNGTGNSDDYQCYYTTTHDCSCPGQCTTYIEYDTCNRERTVYHCPYGGTLKDTTCYY